MSAENSALDESKLNDASYKIATKKLRPTNVDTSGRLDLQKSSLNMSGRIGTTKQGQGGERNEPPRSGRDASLKNSDADEEQNDIRCTSKSF